MTLAPFVRPYYDPPLTVERAEGTTVWDDQGMAYLDCYAGVATTALGHRHPAVDGAVARQMAAFGHVSAIYRARPVLDYAADLVRACEPPLSKVFFTGSGSEAVDLALALAQVTARQRTVVALQDGYHGGTWLTKAATGLQNWRFAGQDGGDVVHVPTPRCHGCTHASACMPPDDCPCLQALTAAVEAAAATGGRPIVLVEPVLGVGGIVPLPPHYAAGLQRLMDRTRGLLAVDEVQTGMGRCGNRLFGYQTLGLTPALVACGKGLAHGWPLAATVMTDGVATANRDLLHFNTFGGHPVSVAAAAATLAVVDDRDFLADVARRGRLLLDLLRHGAGTHPTVDDVRGLGFLIGMEFADPDRCLACMQACRRRGLLVGIGGRCRNVLRLEPALTFSDDECRRAAAIVAAALDD